MPSSETLERFIARVEQNAHAEAIEEFYTEGGAIRENQGPPRIGRSNLVAGERAVLARARSVSSQCIRPVLVNGSWLSYGGSSSSSGSTEARLTWKSLPISGGRASASWKSSSSTIRLKGFLPNPPSAGIGSVPTDAAQVER